MWMTCSRPGNSRTTNRGLQNVRPPVIGACVVFLALFFVFPIPVMASNPTVTITDYHVTPAVLLPGDEGTISFTLISTTKNAQIQEQTSGAAGGGETFQNTQTTDVNVNIRSIQFVGNGITFLTSNLENVGTLGPGQSLPVTVLIKAPENEGMYFPYVWIYTGADIGEGTSAHYLMPVNVNSRISVLKKPNLLLQKTIPDSIVPGDDVSCTITIRNAGEGRADDISITLNASSPSLSLISPANYHIDHLDPGAQTTFDLQFRSDKEVALGIRPVPVTINFADSNGTREYFTENLGIPFIGSARMAVKSLATDPIQPNLGDSVVLTVRVENTGTDRTNSVIVTLDTPFSGTKEAFIGSIDKNSDAPAVFYLTATQAGEVPVVVNISYDDDYGSHSVIENATITVASSGFLAAVIGLIIIMAGAGAAYWYLRLRKRADHAQ